MPLFKGHLDSISSESAFHDTAIRHQISRLTIGVASETCIICLETLGPTLPCRQLPCEHLFHQPCIDEWVSRNTRCPLCRKTFNNLRRHQETKRLPSSPSSRLETAGNRSGNNFIHERFSSLKHWCQKRLKGHDQSAMGAIAEQQWWPTIEILGVANIEIEWRPSYQMFVGR